MLPGHNHNLRHRGAVFHVQTEDGGARDPRVITHLFFSGELLKTERWSYSDLMGAMQLGEAQSIVRLRMMDQHKRMLKRVARGEFDHVLERRPAVEGFPREDTPTVSDTLDELLGRDG